MAFSRTRSHIDNVVDIPLTLSSTKWSPTGQLSHPKEALCAVHWSRTTCRWNCSACMYSIVDGVYRHDCCATCSVCFWVCLPSLLCSVRFLFLDLLRQSSVLLLVVREWAKNTSPIWPWAAELESYQRALKRKLTRAFLRFLGCMHLILFPEYDLGFMCIIRMLPPVRQVSSL